jgi:hypothetical protein
VCVLAAFGLDAVKARVDRSVLVVIPIVISLGAVYVIGATTLPDGLTSTIWILTAVVVMVLLVISSRSSRPERFMWACCVLALTEVLLGSVSSLPQHLRSDTPFTSLGSSMSDWLSRQEGYTIALTPDFGPLSDVVVGLRPNANTLLGIRSVDGYDGGVQITRRWADALQRFNPNPMVDFPLRNNLVAPIDTHVAARTGIRHLVVDRTLHGDEVARGWVGPVRSQGVLDVYSNPDWRGDALSWPVARAFDRGEINDVLRARSNSFVDVALVEADATIVADSCRTRCAVSRWDVVRVHPERIELSGVSDVPSLVSYPRQAGSGWRATIDGLGAPIVPLDALYLAVEVPAGSHTVVFEFRPKWLFPSLVVSALASIAVIAFVVRPGRASSRSSRRRTRDSEQAGPLS